MSLVSWEAHEHRLMIRISIKQFLAAYVLIQEAGFAQEDDFPRDEHLDQMPKIPKKKKKLFLKILYYLVIFQIEINYYIIQFYKFIPHFI